MAIVSNQTEFLEALNTEDNIIEVSASFPLSAPVDITREVTVKSSDASSVVTLTKDATFFGYLFRVTGGALHLQNIILDGDSENHPIDNENNRSLIRVTGGALYLESGSVIQNSNSNLEGGAVYLYGSSERNIFVMNGNAAIIRCRSNTNGGAICLASGGSQDQFLITDQARLENNMAANGGAVYFRCHQPNSGGSLSIDNQVRILDNTASATGGGICFSGYRPGNSTAVSLSLGGQTVFSGNQAMHGGGLYFYAANPGDSLALQSEVSFTQNTASQTGGAICINTKNVPLNITMAGTSITKNQGGTGGGVYILTDMGGKASFTQTDISENTAVNGESGSGGGIWIKDQSIQDGFALTLTDSTLNKNQASAQGGGLAIFAGSGTFTLQMSQDTVTGNQSDGNGGGILMGTTGGGTAAILDSSFSDNHSGAAGGGFYFANTASQINSQFEFSNTSFTGNQAETEGGAIRFTSGQGVLNAVITDCRISGNQAVTNSGGGIWYGGTDNTLTLSGSTSVTNNRSESGNGGGIYFNSDNGTLQLTGQTTVTYNQAGPTDSPTGNHGGGICLVPGHLTLHDQADISFNSALKYGGGVSAAEGSSVTMEGGSIHDNQAGLEGGGIWNHGDSTVMIQSGTLHHNQAPQGNGIYNSATLYVQGEQELSNGVLIQNQSATARITKPLTESSVIQLETSDYVTPNSQGSPIVVAEATPQYSVLSQTDANAFQKPTSGFEGWEIQLNNDHTQIILEPVVYQINYENLMGARNPNPESYTVVTPDIILLPANPETGYRFLGWFDSLVGGNQISSLPKGRTGDITLYAHWEPIRTHTIHYHGNSCQSPCAVHIPLPEMVSDGENITLSTQIPARCSYRFIEWNTDPCGQGTRYQPGMTLAAITESLTLYAQWEPCCNFWCFDGSW